MWIVPKLHWGKKIFYYSKWKKKFLKKKIFSNFFWEFFFHYLCTTVHCKFCHFAMGQASTLLVKHYMGPLNSIRALKWLHIWECTQYPHFYPPNLCKPSIPTQVKEGSPLACYPGKGLTQHHTWPPNLPTTLSDTHTWIRTIDQSNHTICRRSKRMI